MLGNKILVEVRGVFMILSQSGVCLMWGFVNVLNGIKYFEVFVNIE